jgi:hypothetical protein
MPSRARGKNISGSEVTGVSRDGFWVIRNDCEYFVPFDAYPVFRSATVEQIFSMEEIAPGQLRWEFLDADVEVEALAHPERFPLKYID